MNQLENAMNGQREMNLNEVVGWLGGVSIEIHSMAAAIQHKMFGKAVNGPELPNDLTKELSIQEKLQFIGRILSGASEILHSCNVKIGE